MGIILGLLGWAALIFVGCFVFMVCLVAYARVAHDGLSVMERLQTDPEVAHQRRQSYRLKATLFWILLGVGAVAAPVLFFEILMALGI